MPTEPTIVDRPAQPYAAIKTLVTLDNLGTVSVHHIGHPQTLIDATARLLQWAAARELKWDMSASPEGERWGCRLEIYHTDPRDEPDMARWDTELVFRLADDHLS